LALASSIGIIVYTLLLFGLLNRRTKNPQSGEMVWFFLKIAAASMIAAGACFKLVQVLHARIGWETTPRALVVLVIVSSAGMVTIAALAKLFRVRELDSYLGKLHR
jgi:peptidoglycan biosynthesis protein MviN/MurJ (putative lipid II flippase)